MSTRRHLRLQRRAILRQELLTGGARDIGARRSYNRRLARLRGGEPMRDDATDLFATAEADEGETEFYDARESELKASMTETRRNRKRPGEDALEVEISGTPPPAKEVARRLFPAADALQPRKPTAPEDSFVEEIEFFGRRMSREEFEELKRSMTEEEFDAFIASMRE